MGDDELFADPKPRTPRMDFLQLRTKPEEKQAFLDRCAERGVDASAGLREAVRDWMAKQ